MNFEWALASWLGLPAMACLFACRGECPKNRFATAPDGNPGLNYLCPAYREYFRHITQYMNAMAKLVANGQPAALIMQAFHGPLAVTVR